MRRVFFVFEGVVDVSKWDSHVAWSYSRFRTSKQTQMAAADVGTLLSLSVFVSGQSQSQSNASAGGGRVKGKQNHQRVSYLFPK